MLRGLGLPPHVHAVITATPSLRLPWLAATAAACLFAALGASSSRQVLVFLILAPLVPVAGVAAAYGPWADPMFETVQSTPVSGFHVVLARAVAVMAACVPLLGLAAIVLPAADAAAWAWVLPALALSLSSLVVSTFTSLPRAAALVSGLWCATVAIAGFLADTTVLFRGPGQLAFLAMTLAAALAIARRRERFEVEGRRARLALVDAADAERRRIERNIHDGAQQQLVAIGVKAGLARSFVTKDPDRAIAIIDELRADAQEALDGLRDMARGAYPPILADEGLEAAIALTAKRSPLPVTVEAAGIGRLPKPLEIAVYFCCLEAMQNAAKYARAASTTVTIRRAGDDLAFAICDDGVGFDRAAVRRGVGMRSMSERIESLGGSLEVRSSPGRGTMVAGRVRIATSGDPDHGDDRPMSSLGA